MQSKTMLKNKFLHIDLTRIQQMTPLMEILLNPNTKMTHKNADGNVRWAREKLNQSNVNTFVTAASEVWYAQRQYYYGKYNSKIDN